MAMVGLRLGAVAMVLNLLGKFALCQSSASIDFFLDRRGLGSEQGLCNLVVCSNDSVSVDDGVSDYLSFWNDDRLICRCICGLVTLVGLRISFFRLKIGKPDSTICLIVMFSLDGRSGHFLVELALV